MRLLATGGVLVVAFFLAYVAMIPSMSDFAYGAIIFALAVGAVVSIIRIWR